MSENDDHIPEGVYGKFFMSFAEDYSKERVQGFLDEYGHFAAFKPVAWSSGRMGMTYVLFCTTGSDRAADERYFVYLEAPGSRPVDQHNFDDTALFTLDQVRSGEWETI